MKINILLCLIALVCSQQVLKQNQCNDCGQFKSQTDCEAYKAVTCEWIAASGTVAAKCQKKDGGSQQSTFKPYCELVEKPETNCSTTPGCAYLDAKCVHFAGCSAYVKTTPSECQAISYRCVSDGTACIEAQACKDYNQTQCENTPSISGIYKCKWDNNTCRDYACSEEKTYTTNELCNNWQAGCITRGKGCWSKPLPNCSSYTGTEEECNSYIGQDGNCELAKDTTNCKARECSKAPNIQTDDECKLYQKGCITTGKGCYLGTTKPLCSYYSGDISSCVGYIGSDGVCEGDAGGNQCRARKCENGIFKTDQLCKEYQKSCVTNGVKCVNVLSACNSYKGTATGCSLYIGSDGYCTGTSTTTEANCVPKTCDQAPDTNSTDEACEKYQKGCVTTGKGCSTKQALKKCSEYDGGSVTECSAKVGSEGRCTWKSGSKCTPRDCASAPSSTNTNPLCNNWFTDCVTTGSGCVKTTTCEFTVKQQSCEGTQNCAWQPICTSNSSCKEFKRKAICMANTARVYTEDDKDGNPIYVTKKCGWGSSGCQFLECSHLTGVQYSTHVNCSNELSTCMSNGVDACINKDDCSKLKGNKDICKAYPGYCINDTNATETSSCRTRTCTDNVEAQNNPACEAWYPGCISNGQGCVIYTTTCTSLKGNRDTCDKLYGYSKGSISTYETVQCYNDANATADSFCKQKQCTMATDMNESSCDGFLQGCVYNGNGGCVDPEVATCEHYFGDASFCGGLTIKGQDPKYCFGTTIAAKCTIRKCEDKTDANSTDEGCEEFKSGCIAKSSGGCVDKAKTSCTSQIGTSEDCQKYSGSTGKCQRYNSCQDRACGDLTSPTGHLDCINYKSTCRFLKLGSACIAATTCSLYNVPDSSAEASVKFQYCTTIADSSGNYCGYKSGNKCDDRICDQFLSTYATATLTCTNYVPKAKPEDKNPCKLAGTKCYAPQEDCAYTHGITSNDDDKKTECLKYENTLDAKCIWISGTTCSKQTKCENLITQTDAKTCNDYFYPNGKGLCQKVTDSTCITTVAVAPGCASYKLDSSKTEATKKTLCQSLYVIDDALKHGQGTGVFTNCIYKTGDQCSAIASCTDIPSASSQADCDKQFDNCLYFNGQCYTTLASSATCENYTFPQTATNDTLKSLFCNSMKIGSNYCQLKTDKSGCDANAVTACSTFATTDITQWDGVAITLANYCAAKADKTKLIFCKAGTSLNCADATCEDIPNPTKQGDCDNRILGCVYASGKCRTAAGTLCTDVDIPTDVTVSGDKTKFCQLLTKSSKLCTYDEFKTGTADLKCAITGNCSAYANLPSDLTQRPTYCLSKIDGSNHKCAFTTGQEKCRDYDCQDILNPTSQISCDLGAPGKTCVYIQGTCYNTTSGCDKVPASGQDKKAYCELLTSNSIDCTYISGDFCALQKTECKDYDVTNAADKKATCNSLINIGNEKCTYIWGDKCVELGECSSYDGTTIEALGPENDKEATQCSQVKAITTLFPCINHKTDKKKCRAIECADNDGNEDGCKNNVSGCIYYLNKCITKTTCPSYTIPDTIVGSTDKQVWCEGVTDSNDNKCKFDGTKCAARLCSDSAAKFFTDFDCKSYLKTCKTNGQKCVDMSDQCNTVSGNQPFCENILDTTGKDHCKLNSAAVVSGSCQTRTCYDNVSAQSDPDCDNWMKGCVTRGKGCIPRESPCSEYRGTKSQCEAFKQYLYYDDDNNVDIYTLCSGDATNTETSKCKDRKCTDNTSASSNDACQLYLDGCVTKGAGCVLKTADCSAYKGTRETCSLFMGSDGKDYCYNVENASDSSTCQKKKCTDIKGTNNKECSDGMKPLKTTDSPLCVFNGTTCDNNNKKCEEFKGTEVTCASYIALNGPCKSTTVGTIIGSCAKKVCTEAPNTLKTDKECKDYHPDCLTTGYGCTLTLNCNTLINQDSCKSRPECTWANQCEPTKASCSAQSGTSQSNCLNTVITTVVNNVTIKKKCAWTEQGNQCRDQKCEDQPATITSHQLCTDFSETCTTTGAGCITMTSCSGYKTESICRNATSINSSNEQGRCGWENNKCRERICEDMSAKTDAECETHLQGCKTNGSECVSAAQCSDFKIQQYCISSKKGPCLWVKGTCHDYTRCEDAFKLTHSDCQDFSPLCTTNGVDRCIPITSCSKTALQASCVKGTDGDCGYLPTDKCQKFNQCSDAQSNDQLKCQAYGGCVTDGTTCVAKGKCSDFKTDTACKNNGSDGICFYTGTQCKLKECSDLVGTTNDGCKSQLISGGTCTTDGTKCIPLGLCSSYTEAGCVQGTDGTCIYSLPLGQTTGQKACRLKQCEDINNGITNSACNGVIPGKECVSNTKNCIPKAACSTYKTLEACNGGGLDGTNKVACAFTPNSATDKVNGTCKTFSSCSDANSDSTACTSKSACKWTQSGNTTSCEAHKCETFATGTDCQPVPSFDGKSFTICTLQNGKCAAGDPGTMNDSKICYTKSAYTYTWNSSTNKCEQCIAGSTQPNNSNNNTTGGNNSDPDNNNDYAMILPIVTLALLGIAV